MIDIAQKKSNDKFNNSMSIDIKEKREKWQRLRNCWKGEKERRRMCKECIYIAWCTYIYDWRCSEIVVRQLARKNV